MTYKVVALYRFVALDDLPALREEVLALCQDNDVCGDVCGTLLLAPEGINGTIGGMPDAIDNVVAFLDKKLGVHEGELKFSTASAKPFNRLKVRIKKEIVTLRAPEADPTKAVGTYVAPKDWNDLVADPEVTLVDTRNIYETKTGIFKGAIDPRIVTFTQFKDFVQNKMDPAKQKKVAMFCTGGIRCEKASSYMLAHGFEDVYHLKGGILKYLEDIPPEQSLWEGDCFVFDKRVAVGHGLKEGTWDICFGCRDPLTAEDKEHKSYEEGVSCPRCAATLTPNKAEIRRQRHKQMTETA